MLERFTLCLPAVVVLEYCSLCFAGCGYAGNIYILGFLQAAEVSETPV